MGLARWVVGYQSNATNNTTTRWGNYLPECTPIPGDAHFFYGVVSVQTSAWCTICCLITRQSWYHYATQEYWFLRFLSARCPKPCHFEWSRSFQSLCPWSPSDSDTPQYLPGQGIMVCGAIRETHCLWSGPGVHVLAARRWTHLLSCSRDNLFGLPFNLSLLSI